ETDLFAQSPMWDLILRDEGIDRVAADAEQRRYVLDVEHGFGVDGDDGRCGRLVVGCGWQCSSAGYGRRVGARARVRGRRAEDRADEIRRVWCVHGFLGCVFVSEA